MKQNKKQTLNEKKKKILMSLGTNRKKEFKRDVKSKYVHCVYIL